MRSTRNRILARDGYRCTVHVRPAPRVRWRGGVSELLAGVLVTVEDIRLDATIPSLPGSEIDVHFPARLGLTRRAREVHDEFMRPSAFGNAASLPQELLQVEDLVGMADIDVHAAERSGSGRNRVARLTVAPNADMSMGLSRRLPQAFRRNVVPPNATEIVRGGREARRPRWS